MSCSRRLCGKLKAPFIGTNTDNGGSKNRTRCVEGHTTTKSSMEGILRYLLEDETSRDQSPGSKSRLGLMNVSKSTPTTSRGSNGGSPSVKKERSRYVQMSETVWVSSVSQCASCCEWNSMCSVEG